MLVKVLYEKSVSILQENGFSDPDLEVALLLEYLFDISRVDIFISDRLLGPEELKKFEEALGRRVENEPLSYIVSEKEFWSLPFKVSPEVLIPRPETELLLEEALALVADRKNYCGRLLELGTGSGIITVVLALELPCSAIFTSDLSFSALAIAKENIDRHGVAERVSMINGDWLTHLRADHSFDMILSNPPYVSLKTRNELQPELNFEPELALFAGEDGLDAYRKIIPQSSGYLKKGGRILLEIGYDQEDMVRDIFSKSPGMELIGVRKDYSGLPRIAVGRAV